MKRFAIVGVAGYIAPRHLQAIRDTEMWSLLRATPTTWGEFSTATFHGARYFQEFERLDRHAEKLRRRGEGTRLR